MSLEQVINALGSLRSAQSQRLVHCDEASHFRFRVSAVLAEDLAINHADFKALRMKNRIETPVTVLYRVPCFSIERIGSSAAETRQKLSLFDGSLAYCQNDPLILE